MTYNISEVINSVKAGTAIVNPNTQVNADINTMLTTLEGLNNSPEFTTLKNTIESAITAANTAITDVTSRLSTLLPLTKAADKIEKETKILNGTIPADKPTTNFTNIFGAITIPKAQMDQLKIDLTNAQADIAAGGAAATAALGSLTTKINTVNSTVGSAVSSSSSSLADAVSNLKAFAFGSFLSSEQPQHIKDVTNLVSPGNPEPIIAKVEKMTARAVLQTNSTEVQPEVRPKPVAVVAQEEPKTVNASQSDIPPPVGPVGGYASVTEFKEAYKTYLYNIKVSEQIAEDNYQAAAVAFKAWRATNYPNWKTIVDEGTSPDATPTQKATYKSYSDAAFASSEGQAVESYRLAANELGKAFDNSLTLYRKYNIANFNNSLVEPGPPWRGPYSA
jgi:hypothetical protein